MAEREREAMSASLSRLLRTLSSASMSRRHCPLALLQPLPVHQSETTAGSGGSVGSGGSAERCCSSCSDDSNNNERCKSAERGTAAEVEEEEGVELESKEEAEEGEQDELELKRDSSTVNVNVVRANFKCNDMECSLVLGDYVNGFLGSFLSKGLKTNQLVVNTDEKTLRPVARLKEPRDLFALPKDKDNDCSQQAPRWPVECQVIEERITHIPYVPAVPEPLNAPTGNELKPRPVGEENGIVVFSYSPISAVNYEKPKAKKEDDESSDESDYSSDSRQDSTPPSRSTPMRLAGGGGCAAGKLSSVSKMINSVDNRSTSASLDDNDDEYDDEYDTSGGYCGGSGEAKEKAIIKDLIEAKKKRYQEEATATPVGGGTVRNSRAASRSEASKEPSDIDDIWKNNTNEYKPASPRYVLSQFGKNVAKAMIDRIVDHEDLVPPTGSQKVSNQFAVSPVKLPKTNMARLEVAFERSACHARSKSRLKGRAVVPGGQTVGNHRRRGSSSEEDTSSSGLGDEEEEEEDDDDSDSDAENSGSGGGLRRILGSYSARLAGGAEKRPCPGSGSVSDTETLVGDESRSRLASSNGLYQQDHIRSRSRHSQVRPPLRTVPHTHAATVAAAAAALARGRHRDKDGCLGSKDEKGNMGVGGGTTTGNNGSMGTRTRTRTSSPVGNNVFRLSKEQQLLLNSMTSQETTSTLISSTSTNQTTTTNSSQSFFCSDLPQAQFSRSAVGGARFMTNCHPMNPEEYDGLEFESRFESGNLAKAVQITPTYYELYLRPDLYTSRSKQWFYFRVRRTRRKMLYRFSIVNLVKSDSLYNDGMQPVMYSTLGAKEKSEGWRRCGDNICYYRNDDESASNSANEDDEDNSTYTLTFTIEFEHDDDTVFFAHSYPYTYSDLQDYLMEIQRHPVKSKFCKLRLLCRTLAGNNVYYLTVTAPSSNEENMRRKKSIVVSARVHPSETPASWMMKGLMDFITGDTTVAKRLRHKFIFKLVPMLNPDGVIVGNTRNSLTGKDLNRQYRTVIRETYPSIWYTKAMIRRLIEECGVAMYCDMHAHSRKHNIFIYGCENKRNPEKKLTEQVFPLMLHKNSADRFSFESCKFKIQRSKEGTGRIVVWMLGITNSYTIEASFGGSSLGSRKGTHFNTQDYEHMGRAFCETLLDYCDENPNKVKRHAKLFKQIKKIRKREKREQKALKLQKMADQILNLLKQQDRLRSKIIERLMREGSSADEPLNIPLSDYSSDEGNCSSSSDNEGKHSITASDLEGPCCAPTRAPPSSPEVIHEIRKARRTKVRNKPQKKRGEVVRTTLDLPTTDPGSDLHFSTDDEEHSPTSGQNGYGAVAPLRHTLLQSDLQRRYIEEIGDTVVQKPKAAHMPPELIVTTPSKSGTPGGGKKLDVYKLTPRTAPELDTGIGMMQRQAGGTGTSARRTYSWHNLDQQEIPNGNHSGKANFYMGDSKPAIKAITKPPPRRSVPSNFIPQRHGNAQTADDLQLKLSLKKKVWTGAHGDADGRPLAWYKGHSIATSQMANTTTTIRSAGGGAAGGGGAGGAAGAGGGGGAGGQNRNMFTSSGREQTAATGGINMGMPPAFVGAPRRPRKLEQVDLFNACSQKLLLWQQQEEHKRSHPQPAQRLLKVEDPPPHSRDRERDRDRDREQQAFKPMHMAKKSTGTSQAKVIQALVAVESGGKVKRKSSSMMKIAETTQLVTRFARNRNSAGGATVQQQQHQQQPPQQHMHHQHQRLLFKGQGGAGAMGARMHSAGVMGHMQGNGGGRAPNKFKTGGLVITAVQQPTNMAGGSSRRMRNAAGLQAKGSNGALGSSSGQMQYQRSNGSVQANKSATGISLDTVNLVRKVKTKLKKRKSRTLSTGAPK
ncbi:cytosolic carboxypeptidase Nna1 isoform X9 [Drosophila yakuba]|uniref:cytosolic carboxypeptidase Nna1 isoform X9 n=1 Tax=Drosophila yakuba TaxID=7245 RepID=UPI001930811F|nr:cytosolic carboxypeptidase Nna1 isoform X9 [Drosophila yakuba]